MAPLRDTGWVLWGEPLLVGALLLGALAQSAGAQCQRAKLTAVDGAAGDFFAVGVGISAGIAVIGAAGDDDNGPGSGSAYVVRSNGGTWEEEAKLTADDGAEYDMFGISVAASDSVILVGAYHDDDLGTRSGSAYLFRYHDGAWSQLAKLVPDDGEEYEHFGSSVAVSGGRAVVGAPGDDDNGSASGSAYVFESDPNGVWSQTAKLLAADGQAGDSFGDAVAICDDVIVIGAQDDDDMGNWSGSAYVFESDPNGVWSQVAKLLPRDGWSFWNFGTSVTVSADVVLVGADGADGYTSGTGAAYVFERDPNAAWVETAKLTAEYGYTFDAFGCSVALSENIAVIGARWDHQDTSGSAYVFVHQQDGSWSQVAKLVPDDGAYDDLFGSAVAVSGNSAVIGAYQDDDHGEDSGSAYVFAVGPDSDGNGIMDACECRGDLDGDRDVDLSDLAQLLAHYGMTSGASYEDGDLDGDGDVDLADLAALLTVYGMSCE